MRMIETPFALDPAELKSGLEHDVLLLEPRSPGVHQSDLIRDLENTVLKPGQRRADVDISDSEREALNRYRELGLMWEIVLEAVWRKRRITNLDPRKFLRQVEIEHDGVFKTVDAIHIPDWRVLEFKLTFRSSGRTGFPDPPAESREFSDGEISSFTSEFWAWMAQIKGNCLGHGTRLASLFVLFVNGAYHPPIPQTRRFDFIFDDQDLIDNWRMLKNHEKVMRREGRV
jgi:hypothetical protein